MRVTFTAATLLFAVAIEALTITSPSAGSFVDPANPITITWTFTSTDPSTVDLAFEVPAGSVWTPQTLANDIETSSGSYTVPANTLFEYGSGFSFAIKSPSGGSELANTGSVVLANGVYSAVTNANGQTSLVQISSTSPVTSTAPTSATETSHPSATVTSVSGTESSTTNASGVTSKSSTVEVSSSTSSHVTASTSSSRSTSASASSSSTSTASASASSASSTKNAASARASNACTGLGLIGVLAGVIAILA